jgi:eukaryotic-like serine/threonine-protein kinase
VMQYVSGLSLQSRIDASGPESVASALRIAQQVASGLAAAHVQGLVHRDVTPGNVLLEESIERVLLSDFGLARTADDASLTRTGVISGTPHYMSPEQARGENIDSRSDLFCLGSIMYFMLSGHPPFRADGAMAILHRICHEAHRPIDQVNTEVPYEVARLIDRLLTKSAVDRIQTAEIVEKECCKLLTLLQSGGLSLRPMVPQPAAKKNWRSLRNWSLASGIGIAVLATGLSIAYFATRPKSPNSPTINGQRETAQNTTRSERELSVRELREIEREFAAMEGQASEWKTSLDTFSRKLSTMAQDLRSSNAVQSPDPFWTQSTELLGRLLESRRDLNESMTSP